MRWAPTYATTLGDHRYDDRLARRDAAAIAADSRDERDALIVRLRRARSGDARRRPIAVTCKLLRGQLEASRGTDICRFDEWSVDAYTSSPLAELSYLVESHIVTTPDDARNLISRLDAGRARRRRHDRELDDRPRRWPRRVARNRSGARSRSSTASSRSRSRAVARHAEVDRRAGSRSVAEPDRARRELHASSTPRSSRADPAARPLPRRAAAERPRRASRVLRPAERRRVLPRRDRLPRRLAARTAGAARARARARSRAPISELAELGARVLGTTDLAATIAKLRTDRALYFATREEILAAAQTALDRAKAAIPRVSSRRCRRPIASCARRRAYEAPFSTVAYYRQPHYDGSKPGEYFVNTYKPETRARFEMEALTWHESIPGHHLQIAIAQELGALPAFRKLDGSTAYVEGWALYTERLADEMGLYTSDLDRLGKRRFDAWRASRLVVDTGIHALGWTRAQAEAFMREHTALTEINISNEVDRYIGWPGQALAYKVGQLEIVAAARARRGDARREVRSQSASTPSCSVRAR